MAAVLATISPDFLSKYDSEQPPFILNVVILIFIVSLMVSYYLARLEILGAPGLRDTAAGLRALASMLRFDGNSASDVCAKIFLRDDFKSEDGDTRLEIYKLLEALLEKHDTSVMAMGDDYIIGLITLASQERHPRCLVLVFPIIRTILADWNVRTCVHQLWEFIAQYYPISYYVKPGDSNAITSEELKEELRLCIAATSEFAPLSFDFLISKLDTQVSAEVKVCRHPLPSQYVNAHVE
jgi:DNA repair/transcription protein MET18/MMS19